ncbi:MAG: hypothetical protein J2P27_01065 [Actinobacteria bacterium]|nr:hypothetical protein [Actinomycetota bacterium]
MTTCAHPRCDQTIRLLHFPEPRCWPHTSEEQRALLADLDRRGKKIGIKDDCWPYGPNIHIDARAELVNWAEAGQLRHPQGRRCLHWLAKGRCSVSVCGEHRGRHRWMNHASCWTDAGKSRLLVCQPYGVTTDDLADITAVAERHGFNVQIGGTGWYGHGTTYVELQRRAPAGDDRRGGTHAA